MQKGLLSWVGITVIAVLCFIGSGVSAAAAVHVKGYTKKDGTYVAPHYRSSPNSTKADNWSTKGNVNAYTGKEGTRNPGVTDGTSGNIATAGTGTSASDGSKHTIETTPFVSKPTPLEAPISPSDKLRIAKAAQIHELGYDVDWHQHSASELTDMEIKAEKANHLKTLGYPQDWQALSLSQMEDREKRIETAVALKKRGVAVDWEKSSYSQLVDTQTRVNLAERLAREGKVVDWNKHSASQLSAMDAEMARRR